MKKLEIIKDIDQILEQGKDIKYDMGNIEEISVHVTEINEKAKALLELDNDNEAVNELKDFSEGIVDLYMEVAEKDEEIGDHQGDLDGDMELTEDEREDKIADIDYVTDQGDVLLGEIEDDVKKCFKLTKSIMASYEKEAGKEKS